jgi:hypothetical protein
MHPICLEQRLRTLSIFYYMHTRRARWRECNKVNHTMLRRGI